MKTEDLVIMALGGAIGYAVGASKGSSRSNRRASRREKAPVVSEALGMAGARLASVAMEEAEAAIRRAFRPSDDGPEDVIIDGDRVSERL